MDVKEKLVLHLVERAVAYYHKLLAVEPRGLDETKEMLEPEMGSFPAEERGLHLDEVATRVYLFERYGLQRGPDFGFWPEDEYYSTWTFAYDPHLPGVREALEAEELMKCLEWAKVVTYNVLIHMRISQINEERALAVFKRTVQLRKIRRGEEDCPACGVSLPPPRESIRSDRVLEVIQVCQWCRFVVKKELKLCE